MVAKVNFDMQTATVEWFEQGETKGKEIDMAAITALNPFIRILRPGENYINEPPTINQTSLNQLQRVSKGLIDYNIVLSAI